MIYKTDIQKSNLIPMKNLKVGNVFEKDGCTQVVISDIYNDFIWVVELEYYNVGSLDKYKFATLLKIEDTDVKFIARDVSLCNQNVGSENIGYWQDIYEKQWIKQEEGLEYRIVGENGRWGIIKMRSDMGIYSFCTFCGYTHSCYAEIRNEDGSWKSISYDSKKEFNYCPMCGKNMKIKKDRDKK